jgi:bacillithiol system protein YtxJ
MSWFSRDIKEKEKNTNGVQWIELKSIEQAKSYIDTSEIPLVFFKHSTQCSISAMAINRLERDWKIDPLKVIPVYLDLISYRSVSNFLAEYLNVTHQSPQVLIVFNKKCIFSSSHNSITASSIDSVVNTLE